MSKSTTKTTEVLLDPAVEIARRIADVLPAVGGSTDAADAVVRRSRHSDYQVNGIIGLARKLGVSSADLARSVLEKVDLSDIATAVEVADAGFINITLRDDYLSDTIARLREDPRLGTPVAAVPETLVVDYSHPNVAKEMHVGHLRTTIIGDAIVRLMERAGHTVIRENHIGDWGTPFGMLVEHLIDIGENAATQKLSVGELSEFYREARTKFDNDNEFADRARRRVVTLQSGDQESLRLWRILVDQSAAYFQLVYDMLGVLLTPRDIKGESSYNEMLPDLVPDLRDLGILVESDGAQCVFPAGFSSRTGAPLPLMVQKTDGGYGYAATDLATIRDRIDRLDATTLLYVVGAPQRDHLAMCFEVARMAGWLPAKTQAIHIPFGTVLGPDKKPYRTRSGETVKLIELLNEAISRASRLVEEKSPHLGEREQQEVARAVGIGAVKYADLSVDRVRDYVFDWERMLSFDGNTAPYLQYAYARARSLLRKSTESSFTVPVFASHATERELCLDLLSYGSVVAETSAAYYPHKLCGYLYRLASDFATFYEECSVLTAEPSIRSSRLALTELVAAVFKDGLGLLGIEAPERL
jgi:arginyl-tRNA synthetase